MAIKHEEQILEEANNIKGILLRLIADHSLETLQVRRDESKNLQPWYCIQQGLDSDLMEKLKVLQISKS